MGLGNGSTSGVCATSLRRFGSSLATIRTRRSFGNRSGTGAFRKGLYEEHGILQTVARIGGGPGFFGIVIFLMGPRANWNKSFDSPEAALFRGFSCESLLRGLSFRCTYPNCETRVFHHQKDDYLPNHGVRWLFFMSGVFVSSCLLLVHFQTNRSAQSDSL